MRNLRINEQNRRTQAWLPLLLTLVFRSLLFIVADRYKKGSYQTVFLEPENF